MIDAITELFKQDLSSFIILIFVFMSGVIAMVTIVGKFSEIIGRPMKWIKNKNADHELLIQTANNLSNLQERYNETRDDIKDLKEMMLSKDIDDIRWEILDFSSAIINGRKYNREAYSHIFRQYEKYEKILEKNGMENGLVEESIKVIKEIYHDGLKNGDIS